MTLKGSNIHGDFWLVDFNLSQVHRGLQTTFLYKKRLLKIFSKKNSILFTWDNNFEIWIPDSIWAWKKRKNIDYHHNFFYFCRILHEHTHRFDTDKLISALRKQRNILEKKETLKYCRYAHRKCRSADNSLICFYCWRDRGKGWTPKNL